MKHSQLELAEILVNAMIDKIEQENLTNEICSDIDNFDELTTSVKELFNIKFTPYVIKFIEEYYKDEMTEEMKAGINRYKMIYNNFIKNKRR